MSPAALALAKKAFYLRDTRELSARLQQMEAIYLDELMRTADAAEGCAAFMDKRPPQWRHS